MNQVKRSNSKSNLFQIQPKNANEIFSIIFKLIEMNYLEMNWSIPKKLANANGHGTIMLSRGRVEGGW